MNSLLRWITRIGDKAGSLGAVISAMCCAMCFPAIASLGAAVGLGFLGQWEWVFINTVMPIMAWIVLGLNALAWISHRQWQRSVLGMLGPTLLLLSLYPFFKYAWSSYLTYSALGLMVAVSLWDIFSPANKRCDDESCDVMQQSVEGKT